MKEKGKIISLNHAAFKVKNPLETNKFYHDILGLHQEHFTPKDYSKVVFLQGLELMSFEPKDKGKDFEFSHLGFKVENIEAVVEDLESKGVKFIMMDKEKVQEIKLKETKTAVKIAFFKDQNGIECELVEWLEK